MKKDYLAPLTRDQLMKEADITFSNLHECLALNNTRLSTGLSATGTLLLYLMNEAGASKEALNKIKKALTQAAVDMGGGSEILVRKENSFGEEK